MHIVIGTPFPSSVNVYKTRRDRLDICKPLHVRVLKCAETICYRQNVTIWSEEDNRPAKDSCHQFKYWRYKRTLAKWIWC